MWVVVIMETVKIDDGTASEDAVFSPQEQGSQSSKARKDQEPDSPFRFGGQERDSRDHWPQGKKRALGHSRLVCCCVLTKDGPNSICIAVVIVIVVVLFLSGVVPRGEIYSFVLVLLLAVATLTCLTLSVTVDPGILLPRSPLPKQEPGVAMVNGNEVVLKVCPTCNILRPPRSSHCQFCDYCVEEFDHHCGVLGSCVAKRTFRFFGGFFVFLALLVLYIGIRSLIALVMLKPNFDRVEERWALAAGIICLVFTFLGGCVALPFAFYYIYLACLASTQKESSSLDLGFCEPNHNYHRGNCCNFWQRFFGPLGKSRINSKNALE